MLSTPPFRRCYHYVTQSITRVRRILLLSCSRCHSSWWKPTVSFTTVEQMTFIHWQVSTFDFLHLPLWIPWLGEFFAVIAFQRRRRTGNSFLLFNSSDLYIYLYMRFVSTDNCASATLASHPSNAERSDYITREIFAIRNSTCEEATQKWLCEETAADSREKKQRTRVKANCKRGARLKKRCPGKVTGVQCNNAFR